MAAVLLFDARLRRKERNFRDRVTSLEAMSDAEVVSKYRLNKEAIFDLEERLRDDLSPKTDRSQALSSMTKTLIGLRYLAKGDFLSEVSEIHGVSKATAGRVLWPFIDSVNRRVNNIRFPTSRDEINAIKHKFYNTCRIPNVVGAVDGTLIPIIAPAEHEEAYVCRKGFHALNVQAVCDADMRIRDVVAMWPGSQHDAGIFNNCGLKAHLEQNDIGILLGDSGYALKKYLLTSKLRPATEQEERYNTFHSRGRMVVERCFGLLKSRFRCLHKTGGVLPFTPSRSTQVVTACARLHNLCLDYSVPEPHDQVIDAQHPATIMPDDPVLSKVRDFLPKLASANDDLQRKLTTNPEFSADIGDLDNEEAPYIEMNIALMEGEFESEDSDPDSSDSDDSVEDNVVCGEVTEHNIKLPTARVTKHADGNLIECINAETGEQPTMQDNC